MKDLVEKFLARVPVGSVVKISQECKRQVGDAVDSARVKFLKAKLDESSQEIIFLKDENKRLKRALSNITSYVYKESAHVQKYVKNLKKEKVSE